MNDDQFIAAFEDCTLPPAQFHHRDHVRMGFLYMMRFGGLEGIGRFCAALRRFATSLGKPDLYHETITWAYLLLIQERSSRAGTADWDAFAAANADLLESQEQALKNYYSEQTLRSELAKRVFLMPDRASRVG